MERRLAAILSADVVGYTRLMGADETGTLRRLTELRQQVLEPLIGEHHGRVVKLIGDGLLVEFASVVDALTCAVAWQNDVTEQEAATEEDKQLKFRIGINIGDVIIQGDDIYGDGVNVASRLEGLAEPGSICVSAGVYDQVRDKLDLQFSDMGEQSVKNIDRPIRVWKWIAGAAPDPAASRASSMPLGLPDKPSIAVLPFTNLSGDPGQEYFSDGVSENIITDLSRFRSLFVIARNSSFTYKGRAANVQEIGRDLGVRYVVEGSVRRADNRVRVTAQLIETATGRHLWADRYDRELEDIFSLQDEITRTIAAAIEPELGTVERERSRLKAVENLTVWDWYQRGLWSMYQDTEVGNREALWQFEQALELSPDFAPACAASAYVLCFDIINGYKEQLDSVIDEAYRTARKAIALDDKDAMAHVVLGRINLLRCQHEDSIAELKSAVELNPNFAEAYHGLGFALTYSGQPEEAISQFEMAIRLSPYDPRVSSFHEMRAWALLVTGRYEEAAESARTSVRRPNADIWAYATLSAALGHLDFPEEARTAREELLNRKQDFCQEFVRRFVYYNKVPAHLERYIEGLHKAGLPE